MKYTFILVATAALLASCTQDADVRTVIASPVNDVFTPATPVAMPVIAEAVTDCNIEELIVAGPVNFTFMLTNVNGAFVAAPLVATLTIDTSNPANPTASCTNPYADFPTVYQNGNIDENNYLWFDLPFTVNGQVEWVPTIFGFDIDTSILTAESDTTSAGNYYRFVGTLICPE